FYVVSLRSVRAGMASPYRIERDRGTEEAGQQIAVLREKWPLAFPVQHQDVRPLAMGVARHRRRRSGPGSTSTRLIALSLAPVQATVLAPSQETALNPPRARRP